MLLSLLTKLASGALVGYTTNDLAVKMLFRKRFGLGGIVLRTREEFIENISKLVEREIINHHTLGKELNRPEFDRALSNTLRELLENQLFRHLDPHFRLGEIPAIQASFDRLRLKAEAALPKGFDTLMLEISKAIEVSALLSEAQRSKLAASFAQILLQELQALDWTQFWSALHQEAAQVPLSELLSPTLSKHLGQRLAMAMDDTHAWLFHNQAAAVEEVLSSAQEALAVEALIQALATQISNKKLGDLIGEEAFVSSFGYLREALQELLQDAKGKRILDTLAKLLYQTLSKESVTLFELLQPALAERFKDFLKAHLPETIARLIAFIKEQKVKIDFLIDETFRENTKFKIQDWLLKIFAGSVSEKAKIVKRATDYIEKYDTETLAQKVTDYLVEYLQKNSIGSIIQQLPSETFVRYFGQLLQENLLKYIQKISPESFLFLREKKIAGLYSKESLRQVLTALWDKGLHQSFKENYLYQPRSTSSLQGYVQNFFDALPQKPLKEVLPTSLEGFRLESLLSEKALQRQQEALAKLLERYLQEALSDKSLHLLLGEKSFEKLIPTLIEQLDTHLLQQFEQLQEKSLHGLFERLQFLPQLPDKLAAQLKNATLQNLEFLLKGRIEALVKENLQPLPPEQIRDMVERFMGREVAPINVLGALLGGVAGGLLYALPEVQNSYGRWLLPATAYGFTGYGTNWLALKMIFRPYEAKKIGALTLPFTPGIIAKNQGRFAENMGKFVSQSLLNRAKVALQFQERRQQIEQQLIEKFTQNDFETLNRLHLANLAPTSDFLSRHAYSLLKSNEAWLAVQIEKLIDKYQYTTLAQLDTSQLKYRINQYWQSESLLQELHTQIQKKVEAFQTEEKTLSALLPASFKRKMPSLIAARLENWLKQEKQLLEYENLNRLLVEHLQPYLAEWSNKKLEEVLSEENKKRLYQQVADYLWKQLNSPQTQTQLLEQAQKLLEKELQADKPLKDLLNGNLMSFAYQNLHWVLQSLLEDGVAWLKNHQKSLADEVYEKAFQENKGAFLYKKAIRETVHDLAETGIPDFFRKKSSQLEHLLRTELERISQHPLGNLQPEIQEEVLKARLSGLLKNPQLKEITEKISAILIEYGFLQKPLAGLLKAASWGEAAQVVQHFAPELRHLSTHLQNRLQKGEALQQPLSQLGAIASALLLGQLGSLKLRSILEKDEADWQRCLQKSLAYFWRTVAFQEMQRQFTDMFFTAAKNKSIGEALDTEELKTHLLELLHRLLRNPDIEASFIASAKEIFGEVLQPINDTLAGPTKVFVLELLSAAAFEALEQNLMQLLEAIDLQYLVVSEIEAMHPEQVEKLFQSFAGRYFKELINYGFGFGMLFGVGSDALAILLGINKL